MLDSTELFSPQFIKSTGGSLPFHQGLIGSDTRAFFPDLEAARTALQYLHSVENEVQQAIRLEEDRINFEEKQDAYRSVFEDFVRSGRLNVDNAEIMDTSIEQGGRINDSRRQCGICIEFKDSSFEELKIYFGRKSPMDKGITSIVVDIKPRSSGFQKAYTYEYDEENSTDPKTQEFWDRLLNVFG